MERSLGPEGRLRPPQKVLAETKHQWPQMFEWETNWSWTLVGPVGSLCGIL